MKFRTCNYNETCINLVKKKKKEEEEETFIEEKRKLGGAAINKKSIRENFEFKI